MSIGNLYEFSQLCCTVGMLCLGLTLLFIGNEKTAQSQWLKRIKGVLAAVLLLTGSITGLQWLLQLSYTKPLVDLALNITLVYVVTFLMSLAFLPIASRSHPTGSRLWVSLVTFICCIVMLWVALLVSPTLSQIVLIGSTALYLIELARIAIVFFYNYRVLRDQRLEPGSDEALRFSYLRRIIISFGVLIVFAVLYVICVLLSQRFKAIYNLIMLLVWGYLFVNVINMIVEYNGLVNSQLYKSVESSGNDSEALEKLNASVDAWIERGGYRVAGITLTQVAQELATNRYYLSQYIYTRYGCNFKTWITDLRVKYAKHLLEGTSISIDMVASRTGFSNKSLLTAAFKQHEGCTPGVWRSKHSK